MDFVNEVEKESRFQGSIGVTEDIKSYKYNSIIKKVSHTGNYQMRDNYVFMGKSIQTQTSQKPKWLTRLQKKKLTFATARGWVFKKSDNHQEEVLCAIGELATSIGQSRYYKY